MGQQIAFIIIVGGAFAYATTQFLKIRQNILLGEAKTISGNNGQRWRNVFLVAFGQKKMFKHWIPAVFHFFIYAAFLLTQVEFIEIIIDGVFGQHRFFAPYLGGFYNFVINFVEILSLLAFVATIIFLARRNLIRLPRFHKPEMIGWPKLDGNLILLFEIILLVGIFSMNGADILLQKLDPAHYPDTGNLAVSSWLGPALFGGLEQGSLQLIERVGWWLHLSMVLVFLNYLPKSKHLHIFLAFPNTYFANLNPKGQMENMPSIMNEVKSMMDPDAAFAEAPMDEELPSFGANDVLSLDWKNIMDAYSCTECGRCTSVCPANLTGKKLSPRKILMDVRDRAEEVGNKIRSGNQEYIREDLRGEDVKLHKDNFDDGKSLFDFITREEIHACTTCNACVEECPVLINPLDPILKLRRYEILTESAGPSEWLPMFNAVENAGAVWQMPVERDQWATDAMKDS